jgi:hypothetical protein
LIIKLVRLDGIELVSNLLLVLWQIIENLVLVDHLMKAKEICS